MPALWKFSMSVRSSESFLFSEISFWALLFPIGMLHMTELLLIFLLLLQERGPFPGPESGLLSNIQKWIVQGDTCADKARDFIGKGAGEVSSRVRKPRRIALPVLDFMVMGLVSGLSLVNHSDSESFLVVPRWMPARSLGGHAVSPFDLFPPLPVCAGLSVPCSLPGPPVIKQLTQMVTVLPGQGGPVSVSLLPLIFPLVDCVSKWKFIYILKVKHTDLYTAIFAMLNVNWHFPKCNL